MSESTQNPVTKRPQSKARQASHAWKSALVASGVGGVLLGWALLTQVETPNSAAQAQAAAPEAPISRLPAFPTTNDDGTASGGQFQLSQSDDGFTLRGQTQPNLQSENNRNRRAIPQQPRFQRPLTRSRGS
jgi:hypothetical protein